MTYIRNLLLAISLLFAPALAITGCTTVPLLKEEALTAGTTVDAKALYGLEAAYNTAASAYLAANDAKLLSSDLKAKTKPMLVKAYDVLKAARAAYKVGDAVGVTNRYNEAKALIDQVQATIDSLRS